MPSSPKLFHARHSPTSPFYSRRSSVLLLVSCLLIGISGFIFGLTSFFSPRLRYNCSNRDPRTVKVVWDKAADSGGVFGAGTGGIGGDAKRHKVMGFVGIQTGFASVGRRQSLRKTWLPPDREGLQRYCFCLVHDSNLLLYGCLVNFSCHFETEFIGLCCDLDQSWCIILYACRFIRLIWQWHWRDIPLKLIQIIHCFQFSMLY